jgi:ElaA protein
VSGPSLHIARFADLSVRTFHDIVRLRLDTFVVEQGCPYHELDGRDLLPTTEHAWIDVDGEVVCYLRVYPGADGATAIGRVVTAQRLRGQGLATLLMRHALETIARPVRIAAQAQLADWYGTLGFERCGPDFVEDGIVHTPMVLAA